MSSLIGGEVIEALFHAIAWRVFRRLWQHFHTTISTNEYGAMLVLGFGGSKPHSFLISVDQISTIF